MGIVLMVLHVQEDAKRNHVPPLFRDQAAPDRSLALSSL